MEDKHKLFEIEKAKQEIYRSSFDVVEVENKHKRKMWIVYDGYYLPIIPGYSSIPRYIAKKAFMTHRWRKGLILIGTL